MSAAPANLAGVGFWEVASNSPATGHGLKSCFDPIYPTSSHGPNAGPTSLTSIQVASEVYDASLNRNPLPSTPAHSIHRPRGHNPSIASSQQDMMEAQNNVTRSAHQTQDLIDEEQRRLEEEEAIFDRY
jgi:hypothetical protein